MFPFLQILFADIADRKKHLSSTGTEIKLSPLICSETPVLGRFEFVVPALKDAFEYRVVTPSLVTDWYMVNP